jgi:hypothetical protein
VRRLFIILTWIAALSLPAATTSLCIVNCCVLRAAMPHCGGMAKVIAEKPLRDAAPQQKTAPSLKPLRTTVIAFAPLVVPRVTASAFRNAEALRSDRDVGLPILLATLLI